MSENIMNPGTAITVDDGSRRVPILNTAGEELGAFVFRPTDIGIIRRYNDLVARFDGIVAPLLGAADADEAGVRLFEAVNALFASDGAAAAFFGRMNPFSPVNGEFYCQQVLRSVGDYIGRAFDQETAEFSRKAEGYLKKAGGRRK